MSDSYSAGAIDDLKKQMAHNAITWVMRQEPLQWSGSADDGYWGAAWEGKLPPVDGPTGTIRLKWYAPGLGISAGFPPGVKKVGDGYNAAGQGYTEYEIDPWSSIYEPWIEKIDSLFEGWDSIPDPADFEGPIKKLQDAVQMLSPIKSDNGSSGGNDPGDTFSTDFNSVELESALDTMDKFIGADTAGADQGLLVYAFQSAYGPGRIRGIMGNQAQVAVLLGVAMLGEQKLWEKARSDVMSIARTAKDAFKGPSGGDSIDFGIVTAFTGLLETFVPAPLSTALSIGDASLNLVQALIPKNPDKKTPWNISGYTPDDTYSSLSQTMKDFNHQLWDQEREISDNLQKLLDEMRGGAASQFHINPGKGIDPDLRSAKTLEVHPDYLRSIGYQLVPKIAAFMGKAADDVQSADSSSIWQRSWNIGYGGFGPWDNWYSVAQAFDQVTTGSGHELVEAGALLARGAGFVEDSDGWAKQQLAGVEDDIDRGQDDWDNSRLGLPPEPIRLPNGKMIME